MERDRYDIAIMPDEPTLRGFIAGLDGPAIVIFDTEGGVFKRVREPSVEEPLVDIKEIPTPEMLEAFLRGGAVFNKDTGKFELK